MLFKSGNDLRFLLVLTTYLFILDVNVDYVWCLWSASVVDVDYVWCLWSASVVVNNVVAPYILQLPEPELQKPGLLEPGGGEISVTF